MSTTRQASFLPKMICNRLNLCDDDGLQHAYDTQKAKGVFSGKVYPSWCQRRKCALAEGVSSFTIAYLQENDAGAATESDELMHCMLVVDEEDEDVAGILSFPALR